MKRYAFAYRLGLTPWERYGTAAAASIAALLDREEAERSRPLGRALDLGCGRGQYTPELARRGWEVVGVDNVPRAIDAARHKGVPGATFMVGDVTDRLPRLGDALGRGCGDRGDRVAAEQDCAAVVPAPPAGLAATARRGAGQTTSIRIVCHPVAPSGTTPACTPVCV